MTTTLTALMELMPVGFRFHPTDQEVVINYLKPKILGIDPQLCVIPEVDVYKWEPWELPCVFASKSVIGSDDPEWWFLCPRDFKYSNSNRSNRATNSGYWKATGKDRKVKIKGTNNIIATKKTLVFYEGRVPKGVRTNWVMHEYQPIETLPNQRAFVICRIKNKADDIIPNASTHVEGEPSGSGTIPAVFFQPETELGSLFQPRDHHDFSSSQQLPINNQQQPFLGDFSFADPRSNDLIMVQSEFDLTEQEEDPMEHFLNELIVEPDEYYCDEIMHTSIFNDSSTPESLKKMYYDDGAISSDTDTDIAQARFQPALGTSDLFNEHVSTREYRQMRMVKTESGTLPSSNCDLVVEQADPSADIHKINCITVVSPESPVKRKPSKPQYQRRSHNLVAERAAPRINQLQINSLHKEVSKDKAKDAAKQNTAVDLQQKEKSIMESDKERKMAEVNNAKKGLKLTTDESTSSNRKGCFIFMESSPLKHESRPPSVYIFKAVLGLFFFFVAIWEVVLLGKWC